MCGECEGKESGKKNQAFGLQRELENMEDREGFSRGLGQRRWVLDMLNFRCLWDNQMEICYTCLMYKSEAQRRGWGKFTFGKSVSKAVYQPCLELWSLWKRKGIHRIRWKRIIWRNRKGTWSPTTRKQEGEHPRQKRLALIATFYSSYMGSSWGQAQRQDVSCPEGGNLLSKFRTTP